jgi:hypothetical protein
MLKQLIKIKQVYDEAKEIATMHVVNNIESRQSKLIFSVLVVLIILQWTFTVFTFETLEQLN